MNEGSVTNMIPKTMPHISVQPGSHSFELASHDCFYRFVPLVHGASGRVVEYEYPSLNGTEVTTVRVFQLSRSPNCAYFRVAENSDILHESELSRGGTCDFYMSVRPQGIFTEAIVEEAYHEDAEYNQYQDGPELLALSPGLKWTGESLVRPDPRSDWQLDIQYEYRVDTTGWIVGIGGGVFECLRVVQVAHPYRGTPQVRLEAELLNESYLTRDGQCVLVRRYNGPVWSKWNKRLWDGLKDTPRVACDGTEFRLWLVRVPDWALQVDAGQTDREK